MSNKNLRIGDQFTIPGELGRYTVLRRFAQGGLVPTVIGEDENGDRVTRRMSEVQKVSDSEKVS